MKKDGGRHLSFKNIGANDHIPYSKADITKISRVSDNYAFSFYQLDYQAMAQPSETQQLDLETLSDNNLLMAIGKILMDKQGFDQFYDELTQIKNKTESELSE